MDSQTSLGTLVSLLEGEVLQGVVTEVLAIENAFQEFTERKDIAILLINQHVRLPHTNYFLNAYILQIAEKIRPTVDKYQQAFPALLEIPSKDHPYGKHHSCSPVVRV